MTRLYVAALLVLTATACENGMTVEGFDVAVETTPFAFIDNDSASFDTDEDGVDDVTLRSLVVIIADSEDFCSRYSAGDDYSALLISVFTNQELGSNVYTNDSSLGDVYTTEPGEKTWAAGQLVEYAGGELVVSALSESGATGYAGSDLVELDVRSISASNGGYTSMDGLFDVELSIDRSDPDAFDSDSDDDGVDDYTATSGRVQGQFFAAEPCDLL